MFSGKKSNSARCIAVANAIHIPHFNSILCAINIRVHKCYTTVSSIYFSFILTLCISCTWNVERYDVEITMETGGAINRGNHRRQVAIGSD